MSVALRRWGWSVLLLVGTGRDGSSRIRVPLLWVSVVVGKGSAVGVAAEVVDVAVGAAAVPAVEVVATAVDVAIQGTIVASSTSSAVSVESIAPTRMIAQTVRRPLAGGIGFGVL
ncbi:hypothetical protein MaudMau93_000344 [Microsporum audouinii]